MGDKGTGAPEDVAADGKFLWLADTKEPKLGTEWGGGIPSGLQDCEHRKGGDEGDPPLEDPVVDDEMREVAEGLDVQGPRVCPTEVKAERV